ncbi:small secreted protein [Cylindrobasidium torrendii FP15055 ss-10]|uniref:NADH dehydrogenase [ubiquinone] 1 alpha subcomplex subunit 1 n=1 Tax=Cylindrobasidium torrendii FP15055 ss-10 TaxID=1314674 RepID=A0A0D7BU12_9AGAR|nr:small secreted protein [Cylindrobasidium torrendii FP15055 ss-10]
MPLPWEATLPFVLVTVMFGVTGTLYNTSLRAKNDWKPPRYNKDNWDDMMMRRDKLLTGHARVQTDDPIRPPTSEIVKRWNLS